MLFAVAAALLVAPLPQSVPFGDWLAACDNVLHCEALALPREGHDDGPSRDWSLHLSREAGPSGAIAVDFWPAFGEGELPSARLVIDGKPTNFGFGEGRDGRPWALLRAIVAAHRVEIIDNRGQKAGSISVKGLAAALRWIDDRQHRAGTQSALVAIGRRPDAIVPPAPPLPRIALPPLSMRAPRKLSLGDVRAVLKLSKFCDQDGSTAQGHRLDARHTLAIVPCMMGAYQGASLVVVIDEAGLWKPAPIEQTSAPTKASDPADAFNLTSAEYLDKDRLLVSFAKGRGLGDCSSYSSWAWDGARFRLAAERSLDICAGASINVLPSHWQSANDPLAP